MSYYHLLRADGNPITIEDYGNKHGKTVICHDLFYNEDYRNITQEEYKNLQTIIECMRDGNKIPNKFIRGGYGRARNDSNNRILTNSGVNHLHLNHSGDDSLLYYLEYENYYVLLCVGTHDQYMTDDPEGKHLLDLYKEEVETAVRLTNWQQKGDINKIHDVVFMKRLLKIIMESEATIEGRPIQRAEDLNSLMDYKPKKEIPYAVR
ncbi:hypothetical protein [Acetobacter aceti]|uniref:Uncharacterized protein n=1 Tax=Acetobacter aceti TaxID=435 RepID=A0A6S6PGD2_ACEAC|nr:hypothetical protein [Acetobacter aceti]BCI66006.1 hypothetical protein AAJCM20276_06300 [Acetobacter aceti]